MSRRVASATVAAASVAAEAALGATVAVPVVAAVATVATVVAGVKLRGLHALTAGVIIMCAASRPEHWGEVSRLVMLLHSVCLSVVPGRCPHKYPFGGERPSGVHPRLRPARLAGSVSQPPACRLCPAACYWNAGVAR